MIDAVASQLHYAAHLLPIWRALGPDAGIFHASRGVGAWLGARGVAHVVGRPKRSGGPLLLAGWRDHSESRRPLALTEHGIGQSYTSPPSPHYAGGPGRGQIGLFLHPNHHSAARDRLAYPQAQVEVVGMGVADGWERRERTGRVVAFAWHWDCRRWPETMATWQWWWPAVARVVQDGWEVLGHGHPLVLDRLRSHYQRLGVPVVPSLEEVVERADVVVGDNTSALYLAAMAGCKVVVLDAPWYRREVVHGGRFWEWADVGIRISRREELGEALERAVADPPEVRGERERVVGEVDPFRDGRAAVRSADALREWASSADRTMG